jgi:hypothetical protein
MEVGPVGEIKQLHQRDLVDRPQPIDDIRHCLQGSGGIELEPDGRVICHGYQDLR